MHRSDAELPQVFLQPGEFFLAREPAMIGTILGSCIGVTFWSPKHMVGALCHAMLPAHPRASSLADGLRYVDFCIHNLARLFDELGATRAEVQVKVFGGADMFASTDPARPTVGKQNRDLAIDMLRAEGYRVAAHSIGDTFGRKIKFNTRSGDVFLLRLT
jgi:chemotaxis protein CheD